MAKIKVMDFLKDVELNRRLLISTLENANKVIDSKDSLSSVVEKANEVITNCTNPTPIDNCKIPENHFEIRYVDIDATLLKREIVKYGESTTPPPPPSFDSERLEFVRWGSAIGDKFDDIKSDIDYAPIYRTKIPNSIYLFLDIDEITGYIVKPYFRLVGGTGVIGGKNQTLKLNENFYCDIDWGDGQTEIFEIDSTSNSVYLKTLSHTYSQNGSYIVRITYKAKTDLGQNALDSKSAYMSTCPEIFVDTPTSSSSYSDSYPIYTALKRYYCDYFTTGLQNAVHNAMLENLEIFIPNRAENFANFLPSKVVVVRGKLYHSSGTLYINLSGQTEYLIWDIEGKKDGKTNYHEQIATWGKQNKIDKFIVNGAVYPDRDSFLGSSSYSCRVPDRCPYLKKIVLIGNFPLYISSESANSISNSAVEIIMTDEQKEWVIPDTNAVLYNYNFVIPYVSKNIRNNVSGLNSYGYYPLHSDNVYLRNGFEWRFHQYSYINNLFVDKDYARRLDLKCWIGYKDPIKLVYVLNQLKDLSSESSQQLTFDYGVKVSTGAYVQEEQGFYRLCKPNDDGAITILEAFANKNWTISFANGRN